MGNAWVDGKLSYTGAENDCDPIILLVGGNNPTGMIQGYFPEDCTMDGAVQYTGKATTGTPYC